MRQTSRNYIAFLSGAFEENDFDGFELRGEFEPASEDAGIPQTAGHPHVSWRKSGSSCPVPCRKNLEPSP